MIAYEQSLKLFRRWCMDEMGIFTVDKVTENIIRRYISELQERGKYTFTPSTSRRKTTTRSGGGTTAIPSARQQPTTIFATFGVFFN